MIYISDLYIGCICTLKKTFVIKNGFDLNFVKQSQRPFVVSEITDYGAIWLVPSYSHCTEYCDDVKDFYYTLRTPNGNIKYLNIRNMVVVTCSDIDNIFTPSNDTIQIMKNKELKNYLNKFRFNKRYLKLNKDKAKRLFKNPFNLELEIIKDYLKYPYIWLERDYNIVDKIILFNKDDELNKSDIAKILYHNYIQNLKYFRIKRDAYISERTKYLNSLFISTKIKTGYICLTEQGYIFSIESIVFTEKYNESKILTKEECKSLSIILNWQEDPVSTRKLRRG